MRKTSITIPVDSNQYQLLKTVSKQYVDSTPYDYAFIGYRCASAAYDVLSKISILKPKANTSLSIFYPKLLRKKLLHMAKKMEWEVAYSMGSSRRKWER